MGVGLLVSALILSLKRLGCWLSLSLSFSLVSYISYIYVAISCCPAIYSDAIPNEMNERTNIASNKMKKKNGRRMT